MEGRAAAARCSAGLARPSALAAARSCSRRRSCRICPCPGAASQAPDVHALRSWGSFVEQKHIKASFPDNEVLSKWSRGEEAEWPPMDGGIGADAAAARRPAG